MDGYRNTADVAKEWGISERRLNILCKEGRIPGGEKFVRKSIKFPIKNPFYYRYYSVN